MLERKVRVVGEGLHARRQRHRQTDQLLTGPQPDAIRKGLPVGVRVRVGVGGRIGIGTRVRFGVGIRVRVGVRVEGGGPGSGLRVEAGSRVAGNETDI